MRSQARKHVGSGDITGGRAAYHAAKVTVRYLLAAMRRDDAQRTAAHVYLSYWASALRLRLRRDYGCAARNGESAAGIR